MPNDHGVSGVWCLSSPPPNLVLSHSLSWLRLETDNDDIVFFQQMVLRACRVQEATLQETSLCNQLLA